MTTISPEQRSVWRAACTPPGTEYEEAILALLDALENIETKNASLLNLVEALEWERECRMMAESGRDVWREMTLGGILHFGEILEAATGAVEEARGKVVACKDS